MGKWIGLAGLTFWLGGTATLFLVLSRDVASEPVEFRTADGTPIHGTLYSPRRTGRPLPAVVVVHGVAVAGASCAPGLAIPLAQNGYLTLAVDVRGHGHSGGTLPRGELNDHLAMLDARAPQPEVEAAVDFLERHPRAAGPGVVLVGHSRGGWAATSVGLRRDDVRGVVCIGAAPVICDPTSPRNFFLLTAGVEDLCPPRKCLDALALATGGAADSPGQQLGEFDRGTARSWQVIDRANHFSTVVDNEVTRRVVQWVGQSFGAEGEPVSSDWLPSVADNLLIACVGGFLAACYVLAQMARRLLAPPPLVGRPWRPVRAGLFLLLMTLAVPAFAAVARHLEYGPVCFAMPSIVLLVGAALISLVVSIPGAEHYTGAEPPPARWTIGRGLALGALALVLAFLWFGVPAGATLADLVPTVPRLALALVLLPALFPASLILALGVRRQVGGGVGAALVWLAIP